MSEPTDPLTNPTMPEWYVRLRGNLDRCVHWRDAVALRPVAEGWEALAKYEGDELAEDLAVSLQRDAIQRGADLHDLMLLRDHFEWRPLPSANNHDGPLVCYTMRLVPVSRDTAAHTVEVGRLSGVGDKGAWQATLNQHGPLGKRRVRDCTSYEAGRFGVELWAAGQFARLQAEARAMLAGFPSGSWDECRAKDCTRGSRFLCDACEAASAELHADRMEGFRQEMAGGLPTNEDDGEGVRAHA